MARLPAFKGLQSLASAQLRSQSTGIAAVCFQQTTAYATVPEFWGRPSAYTEGTEFLGTPTNHLELVKKRPLSPDVFEIGNQGMHYKFPPAAISSVLNRATGCVLSVGSAGMGYLALTSQLTPFVDFLAAHPVLLIPTKAALAYPLIFHYLCGLRHLYWDEAKYGIQADKSDPLEVPRVTLNSNAIIYGTAAVSAVVAVMSF